jgi:hypothetical protein
MLLGTTDETYGVNVWLGRIAGLQSHLRIIRDHLPEDAAWLRNQVNAALNEADRYVADAVPEQAVAS